VAPPVLVGGTISSGHFAVFISPGTFVHPCASFPPIGWKT
jgi:hypothetical protein